jgi:hypothetical protein
MSFLRTSDKRKRRVSPEDVLQQLDSAPIQKALQQLLLCSERTYRATSSDGRLVDQRRSRNDAAGSRLPRLNLYKTYFLFTAPLRLRPVPVQHEWAESARLPWEAEDALAT